MMQWRDDQPTSELSTYPEQHVSEWIMFDDLKVNPWLGTMDDTDLATHLGLPPLDDPKVRKCSNAIILSLLVSCKQGYSGTRYSRDNNRYGQKKYGDPKYWNADTVRKAVAHLQQAVGAIFHERQLPCNPAFTDGIAQQSRLVAGPELYQPALVEALLCLPEMPDERIILRGVDREHLPLYDHSVIRKTESFLAQYDDKVSCADLQICHPKIKRVGQYSFHVPYKGKFFRRLSTRQRYPRRIFNQNLNSGGRLYHVFWCVIPSAFRRGIKINDCKTREHDFNACHPTLAHRAVGCDTLPCDPLNGDLYAIKNFDQVSRDVIKIAFQIQLNARSPQAAMRAIAKMLCGDRYRFPRHRHLRLAREVMSRIEDRYPALEELWYTGAGLRLQYVDSEIVRSVLSQLMNEHGVLGLSVHDSIIVAEQHFSVLVRLMETTFDTLGAELAYDLFSSTPQSGGVGICDQKILTVGRSGASLDDGTASGHPSNLVAAEPASSVPSRIELQQIERWASGSLPGIVPIQIARPWNFESRGGKSTWFKATPDPIDRQVRALVALKTADNREVLSQVVTELNRVRALRSEYGPPFQIQVDELIERLDESLV